MHFDGVAFDPFPVEQDDVAAAEVDVGRREILQALVISGVIPANRWIDSCCREAIPRAHSS